MADTGEALPGSDGVHVYVLVKDGADIERCLRALHERCWLAGLGWMMVSSSGGLLERFPLPGHVRIVPADGVRVNRGCDVDVRVA